MGQRIAVGAVACWTDRQRHCVNTGQTNSLVSDSHRAAKRDDQVNFSLFFYFLISDRGINKYINPTAVIR